jgi:hypothetical protein
MFFFYVNLLLYLATTKSVTETKRYETPMHNQSVPLNGSIKANRVGGTFSGALYRIEIPDRVHNIKKPSV